jgi:hypothetical protein
MGIDNYHILHYHFRRVHHHHHHHASTKKAVSNFKNPTSNLKVNPLDKKRHSFTAPQLKPSQKYQLKINELIKDEQ